MSVHAPIKDTQNTASAHNITPSTKAIFFATEPLFPFFFDFTGFVDIEVEPFDERIYETPFDKAYYPVIRFPSAP